MLTLFAHHAKSWLGLEIEINGEDFPGGMLDHVLVVVAAVLMVYGAVAVIRDLYRWLRGSRTATA